ncbi:hypothetical protein [Nocardioides antri]|uniref:MmpS family membrane protein n=1 Tax=Nocardioides antri TaxID=2607659 RepID=A0A5B1M6K9_9ACTN|nr:hypothetical protein [Nocardioides antri]KAA1428236.1 hypothetical protein F0U47_04625 [Nocardioides antri]
MPYRHHYRNSRRKAYWALGAVAVVVLVVVGLLVVSQRDGPDGDSSTIATDRPTERGTDRDDQRRRHDKKRRDKAGSKGQEDPPSWLAGAPDQGAFVPGGAHRAVLTVTSAQGTPVGVKYAFRTGATYRDGTVTANGSWRAAETVRGHEPLAGVIGQVASGSVTCTATLDGRVISTRTSSGRFATVLCAA